MGYLLNHKKNNREIKECGHGAVLYLVVFLTKVSSSSLEMVPCLLVEGCKHMLISE